MMHCRWKEKGKKRKNEENTLSSVVVGVALKGLRRKVLAFVRGIFTRLQFVQDSEQIHIFVRDQKNDLTVINF